MRNTRNKRRGLPLMLCGLALVLLAAGLAGYNLYQDRQASRSAETALQELEKLRLNKTQQALPTPSLPVKDEVEYPDYVLNPHMNMPEEEIGGWPYIGTLEIPALGLTLPVISHWSDAALNAAPARYTGSAYTGDMVIAGHNYRTHFNGLKYLPVGETVLFTDMDGNEFFYEVTLIQVLKATAVEEMAGGDWDLTLFTCTSGGSARMAVRCQRIITAGLFS